MPRIRLAVATRTWPVPLPEAVRAAAKTGATGVQLDVREELPPGSLSQTGLRDFLHTVRELGLSVASTNFPLRHPLASEHQLDRRLAAIREAMQFTYELGAQTVCLPAGRLPEDLASREGTMLHEVLSDLARHGNHVGVTLALTPLGDAAGLRECIAGIATGPMGVDFDPSQFVQAGLSTTESLRTLHGLVAHVQLRDGVRTLAGGGEETALGQGAVDWIELLALLTEMDYAGWLTAIRNTGDDRPRDVARAVTQVKKWLYMTLRSRARSKRVEDRLLRARLLFGSFVHAHPDPRRSNRRARPTSRGRHHRRIPRPAAHGAGRSARQHRVDGRPDARDRDAASDRVRQSLQLPRRDDDGIEPFDLAGPAARYRRPRRAGDRRHSRYGPDALGALRGAAAPQPGQRALGSACCGRKAGRKSTSRPTSLRSAFRTSSSSVTDSTTTATTATCLRSPCWKTSTCDSGPLSPSSGERGQEDSVTLATLREGTLHGPAARALRPSQRPGCFRCLLSKHAHPHRQKDEGLEEMDHRQKSSARPTVRRRRSITWRTCSWTARGFRSDACLARRPGRDRRRAQLRHRRSDVRVHGGGDVV